ncbi:hypothetical protein Leryth_008503 [Lithospermum erythrorhizon]|nr:hypothetical protein Leryth_008503 [Lithospermum erythrorhizon]
MSLMSGTQRCLPVQTHCTITKLAPKIRTLLIHSQQRRSLKETKVMNVFWCQHIDYQVAAY